MSINSLKDWSAVEMKAQEHELSHVETPKIPTPLTICGEEWVQKAEYTKTRQSLAQQLLWVTTDLAKAKVSAARKDRAISEAMMYLSIGATDRAKEVLNRAILDL